MIILLAISVVIVVILVTAHWAPVHIRSLKRTSRTNISLNNPKSDGRNWLGSSDPNSF
jgi:hypothetical protein